MSAAFTPGPWVWMDSHGVLMVDDKNEGSICVVSRRVFKNEKGQVGRFADTEHRANAQLIAAAPALLAALTRLCRAFPTDADMKEAGWEGSEIEEGCNAYDAARAAVAKATGSAA